MWILYLALLKVGCSLSKDIHDFIYEAKAHASIHHFEDTSHHPNEQYAAQTILKNWNRRMKELSNERNKE